jgi:hypothetical protein
MANQSRKVRGRSTEKILAEYYQSRGWPFAERTGAGRAGVDITGMPGLAPEVKARRGFEPVAWLKQAETRPGVPFVVFRPNGFGEASVSRWGVLMTVEEHTKLLRDAGYGDPLPALADADIEANHEDADQERGHRATKDDAQPTTEGNPRTIHAIEAT